MPEPMLISSPSFGFGDRIPDQYTQVGDDVAPPIMWSGLPEGTGELALICHDPDAPRLYGWSHWVLYGITPSATGIEAGELPGSTNGVNEYGAPGYSGPMPPEGHGVHSYYFFLVALDKKMALEEGLDRSRLMGAISDNVITVARHVGTYSRD